MAAGVTSKLWEIEDILRIAEPYFPKAGKRGTYRKRNSELKMDEKVLLIGAGVIAILGNKLFANEFIRWEKFQGIENDSMLGFYRVVWVLVGIIFLSIAYVKYY